MVVTSLDLQVPNYAYPILIAFYKYMISLVNEKRALDVVYLDFSKDLDIL